MRDFNDDAPYLFGLGGSRLKLGLEKIGALLTRMGRPHLRFECLHVAGTNGKGSVTAILERLLLDAGFTVGATISPHLVKFNERIRYGGTDVDDEALNRSYNRVLRALEADGERFRRVETWSVPVSFFELAMAIAFDFFAFRKPDWIILETGLGGRLDATNVCVAKAHLFTSISYDHTEILGEGIVRIASEKAGIIRSPAPVFCAKQAYPEAFEVLRERAFAQGAPFFSAEEEVQCRSDGGELVVSRKGEKWFGLERGRFALRGEHQLENLSLALSVFNGCFEPPDEPDVETIVKSLASVRHPGRMEMLEGAPPVLLDGAHNEAGGKRLLDHLDRRYAERRILLCVAWGKNKNILAAFRNRPFGFSASFQPVKIDSKTALPVGDLSLSLSESGFRVMPSIDVETLVRKLAEGEWKDFDLVVVGGSLYFVGEFYRYRSLASGGFG